MNRPLHTTCPACSGTGKVSWLRSGTWINEFCPKNNGPIDVDSQICGHELDNFYGKRLARIEYKRKGETLKPGQRYHIEAFLSAFSESQWHVLWLVVIDEGQTGLTDTIRFQNYNSWQKRKEYQQAEIEIMNVKQLAQKVCRFIWPPAQNAYLPMSVFCEIYEITDE
jgi:hypothetical protein